MNEVYILLAGHVYNISRKSDNHDLHWQWPTADGISKLPRQIENNKGYPGF